MELQSDFVL